jgi:16S rRNA (guanine527-N7)-methyltransferase
MTPARIAELLAPFQTPLGETSLQQISTYIDLLLRWNARINLTAIRAPEEIVTRHFGESLFAAKHLFPIPTTGHVEAGLSPVSAGQSDASPSHVIDVGSGPGFPGLPIKIWNPSLHLTLIESNQKKATFLREVIRTLTLTNVNVFASRAENHPPATADVATFRAVERFDQSLLSAARLVTPAGRLALLIGSSQVDQTLHLAPTFTWKRPIQIPSSRSRFLLIGFQVQSR